MNEVAMGNALKYLAQHPGDDEVRSNMELPILDGSIIIHKYYIDRMKNCNYDSPYSDRNHYIDVDGGMLKIKFVKNIGE